MEHSTVTPLTPSLQPLTSIAFQDHPYNLQLIPNNPHQAHSQTSTQLGLSLNSDERIIEEEFQMEDMLVDLRNGEDQSPPITLQTFFNDLNILLQSHSKPIPQKCLSKRLNRKNHSCSICHQTILRKTTIYRLQCQHYFHSKCLDSWRIIKNSCPLCRRQIV